LIGSDPYNFIRNRNEIPVLVLNVIGHTKALPGLGSGSERKERKMKKDKPARPDPMQPNARAPVLTEIPAANSPVGHKVPKHRLLKFVSTAHSIAKSRNRHGCLNRDTLNKLGKALVSGFDGVRNEGVPNDSRLCCQEIEIASIRMGTTIKDRTEGLSAKRSWRHMPDLPKSVLANSLSSPIGRRRSKPYVILMLWRTSCASRRQTFERRIPN